MKKIIIILLLITFLITGCSNENSNKVNYSQYAFTDVVWERDAENDLETIIFESNGSFTYYCACGNPVNDSDLCETYTYNDTTKEIRLNCSDVSAETITIIKVVESTKNTLKLDFGDEIREFKREK